MVILQEKKTNKQKQWAFFFTRLVMVAAYKNCIIGTNYLHLNEGLIIICVVRVCWLSANDSSPYVACKQFPYSAISTGADGGKVG